MVEPYGSSRTEPGPTHSKVPSMFSAAAPEGAQRLLTSLWSVGHLKSKITYSFLKEHPWIVKAPTWFILCESHSMVLPLNMSNIWIWFDIWFKQTYADIYFAWFGEKTKRINKKLTPLQRHFNNLLSHNEINESMDCRHGGIELSPCHVQSQFKTTFAFIILHFIVVYYIFYYALLFSWKGLISLLLT